MGARLLRFFEVFTATLVAESESTLCRCVVCRNLERLKLKAVVHSGEALFHTIDGHAELSGVDVILAHRLLKNSVPSDEYILMTDAAHRDVCFPEPLRFEEDGEEVEGLGVVRTFVHRLDATWERSRDAFFAAPAADVLATTLPGGLREVAGQFRTWARGESTAGRSLASALWLACMTPVQLVLFPLASSVRALWRRSRR